MSNYLIEGISGTGKTTVGNELAKRGFRVIDSDEAFGFYGDPKTGLPVYVKSQLNWIWDKSKVEQQLVGESERIIFVTGGAMNQEEFMSHFTKVFTLFVDDKTLKDRLTSRTNNDFGKRPEDLERQLEWNKGAISYSKKRGTVLIDAMQPIEAVVDEILSHIGQ